MSRAVPRFKRVNPALPPVGQAQGVALYRLVGTVAGQITISTFTYLGPSYNPTSIALGQLLTSISTNLRAAYLACVSSDWTLVDEQISVIHRNDLATQISTTNAGAAGTRPSPTLSTTMAAVILRSTVVKGQHGRGRLSLPAVCASDCTASRITNGTMITNLGTLVNKMILSASDTVNTWIPCIAQRSPQSPKLAVGASALANISWSTLLGTIRRRKIGRGI